MRLYYKIRNWVFGSRQIAVGHCNTPSGSGVLLIMGRKRAGLTPAGARNIADQLRVWAAHAETSGKAIQTMQWIVHLTMTDAKNEASSWMPVGLDEAASALKTANGTPDK